MIVAITIPVTSGMSPHSCPANADSTPMSAPAPTETAAHISRMSSRSATETPRPTSSEASRIGRPTQSTTAFWYSMAMTMAVSTESPASHSGKVTRRSVPAELSRDSTTTAKVTWPKNVPRSTATAIHPCSWMENTRDEIDTVAAGMTASDTPPTSVISESAALFSRSSGGRSVVIVTLSGRRCGDAATR